MRDQLFAHADASLEAAPNEYPNEAVIVNDGQTISMNVSRSAVIPSVLQRMIPLVESLIEKTNYRRQKYAKRFSKEIAKLPKGEFRLNVADPAAPLFTRLTTAEARIRRDKKRFFDLNSDT
jgi:hypothetical protein